MIPANKDGSNMAKELMYQFNKSRWKMELPEEVGINLDIGGSNRGRSRLSDRIPHSGGVGHRVSEVVEYSTEQPQSSNGSLEADKEDEGSKQASSVYKQSEDGCEEPYLAELFDFIVTVTMRALGLVGLLTNFAVKIESQLIQLSRFVTKLARVASQSTSAAVRVRPKEVNRMLDTGVHVFDEIPKNPLWLFKKWHSEQPADNYIGANAFCLSTATKEGKVSSRNLILRRLDEDGFVLMTDARSKKVSEMESNPYAAMTFLWVTEKEGKYLSRQVRIEGEVRQLPADEWADIYEREPLFAKIRSYVCDQGQKVDWNELKQNHDRILREYEEGKNTLPKPDHVVAFKMNPIMMEFYESLGPKIADRVMYLKENGHWEQPARIAA